MPEENPKRGRFRRAASTLSRIFGSRPPHREADVPLDEIEHAYTPTQTSLKGPFRTSGAERQRDQELAGGVADDRWKDEDRITNKSGDPRIGTHGRTYEPDEKRRR